MIQFIAFNMSRGPVPSFCCLPSCHQVVSQSSSMPQAKNTDDQIQRKKEQNSEVFFPGHHNKIKTLLTFTNMNIASPASSGSPLSPHSPCAFDTTTEARFADLKAQATPSSSVSSPVCGDSQMAWVNHSKRVRAALGPPTASESNSVAKRPARKKRKGVLHVSSAARQPTLEDNIYVHLSHEVRNPFLDS